MAGEAGFAKSALTCGLPDAPAFLVCALPYGNQGFESAPPEDSAPPGAACIAPFARRNYYREAVKRLQKLATEFRRLWGGSRGDYRIFCNSRLPEKPLAEKSGLGSLGRNGLIIIPGWGSLTILAAITLPVALPNCALEQSPDAGPAAGKDAFPLCASCGPERPPCAAACPTAALPGDGSVILDRCIQWYASGNGSLAGGLIPPLIAERWGRRLYGCTNCQDACPHNRTPIPGVQTQEGALPAFFDAREILSLTDEEIKARFRHTALGLSWLGPEAIRRNARAALGK